MPAALGREPMYLPHRARWAQYRAMSFARPNKAGGRENLLDQSAIFGRNVSAPVSGTRIGIVRPATGLSVWSRRQKVIGISSLPDSTLPSIRRWRGGRLDDTRGIIVIPIASHLG